MDISQDRKTLTCGTTAVMFETLVIFKVNNRTVCKHTPCLGIPCLLTHFRDLITDLASTLWRFVWGPSNWELNYCGQNESQVQTTIFPLFQRVAAIAMPPLFGFGILYWHTSCVQIWFHMTFSVNHRTAVVALSWITFSDNNKYVTLLELICCQH